MEAQTDVAPEPAILCSACFRNEGLRLDAVRLGWASDEACPQCGATDGSKLSDEHALKLAHRFFVVGSLVKTEYGGASVIQFNDRVETSLDPDPYHGDDAQLLSRTLGVGFFYHGPPTWAVGEVEPLKALEDPQTRAPIIARILAEYPRFTLSPDQTFYRLRKAAARPQEPSEYDSPPDEYCGGGRLDAPDLPILYGSADLELCIHECRVTVADELHIATLKATRPLTLLDLTALIDDGTTSFESLDMAVHLLFLAASHSYPITRDIAAAAHRAGMDGVLFPSYFSLLRTGEPFLETVHGLSTRVFAGAAEYEAAKIVENIALFGRPIADGRIAVACINRLYLRQASYDLGFGPASY